MHNYTYNDTFHYNVRHKGPGQFRVEAFTNNEVEWTGDFRDGVIAHEVAALWIKQCRALRKSGMVA